MVCGCGNEGDHPAEILADFAVLAAVVIEVDGVADCIGDVVGADEHIRQNFGGLGIIGYATGCAVHGQSRHRYGGDCAGEVGGQVGYDYKAVVAAVEDEVADGQSCGAVLRCGKGRGADLAPIDANALELGGVELRQVKGGVVEGQRIASAVHVDVQYGNLGVAFAAPGSGYGLGEGAAVLHVLERHAGDGDGEAFLAVGTA